MVERKLQTDRRTAISLFLQQQYFQQSVVPVGGRELAYHWSFIIKVRTR